MAKERPINNIRVLEGERPFKLYNPEISASNLMFIEPRHDQQQMALNMSGYAQHQQRIRHTNQQPHQQMLQQCQPQAPQFGFTDDYRAMHQNQASPMTNEVSLQSFIYDDLGLDLVNHVSSEPINLSDIISGPSGKVAPVNMPQQSGSCLSNFMPSNRNMRNTNGPDPLASFFDPPPLSPFTGNGYPTSALQSNAMGSAPIISMQYSLDNSTPFAQNSGIAINKEIETLPRKASNKGSFNLFKVKQERHGPCSTSADSPSPSSVHSPSSSDICASDTQRSSLKRSSSEGSSPPLTASTSVGARDSSYLEKRKKNNESAKRCREARRKKEGMLAMRIVSLEEENVQLRTEMCLLERELEDLRDRLFT